LTDSDGTPDNQESTNATTSTRFRPTTKAIIKETIVADQSCAISQTISIEQNTEAWSAASDGVTVSVRTASAEELSKAQKSSSSSPIQIQAQCLTLTFQGNDKRILAKGHATPACLGDEEKDLNEPDVVVSAGSLKAKIFNDAKASPSCFKRIVQILLDGLHITIQGLIYLSLIPFFLKEFLSVKIRFGFSLFFSKRHGG
jgi:hypothetical protein